MEIGSTLAVHGTHNMAGAHRAASTSTPRETMAPRETVSIPFPTRDEVTLSPEALLSQAAGAETTSPSGPIRFDLVNRIRAEIAAGTYDTPDKLSSALDRMLTSHR